jgi:RecG-like helicase
MSPHELLTAHFRIDATHLKALKKLGILSVGDLLFHLPARYEDISDVQSVGGLEKGQDTVVYGQLSGLKTRKAWKSKIPIAEGYIEDGSAKMTLALESVYGISKCLMRGILFTKYVQE